MGNRPGVELSWWELWGLEHCPDLYPYWMAPKTPNYLSAF